MNSFYHKNILKQGNYLSEEESKHCVQVLRHKVGDQILVLDGKGGRHEATITATSKRACAFEVMKSTYAPPKSFRIHLAIAPTKNIDRMEWLIEKLTEIGVDEISLIHTDNSERKKIRMDRLEKKALSALKQSKNPFLPKINALISLKEVLSMDVPNTKKLIAHVNPEHTYIGASVNAGEEVLVVIGPEGDFSEPEVSLALENGFQPISLGSNTLRTETAGLMACCALNLINKY